jgi:hypothetical protein
MAQDVDPEFKLHYCKKKKKVGVMMNFWSFHALFLL